MQTGVIQKLLSTDHELSDRTERIQLGLRDEFGPTIATSLLLLEVRERLDHGAFKPYCTLIGIKMRSAQNRLNVGRLARRYGDDQVARLQIGAAQVLGGKSAPKRVVEEIMTVWGFVGGSHYQSRDGRDILLGAGADRVFARMADFWQADR